MMMDDVLSGIILMFLGDKIIKLLLQEQIPPVLIVYSLIPAASGIVSAATFKALWQC